MLFQKKKMNKQAAEDFWNWFLKNETWIIEQTNHTSRSITTEELIFTIDAVLTPVFPYEISENIEFLIGANFGNNEFFFYYNGIKELKRDGEILKSMMPDSLKASWTFRIEI